MSKHEIIRSLRREIKTLNRVIDIKIIKGLPYYAESRRHRFLTSQLNRLSPQHTGWIGRLAFASMFMF